MRLLSVTTPRPATSSAPFPGRCRAQARAGLCGSEAAGSVIGIADEVPGAVSARADATVGIIVGLDRIVIRGRRALSVLNYVKPAEPVKSLQRFGYAAAEGENTLFFAGITTAGGSIREICNVLKRVPDIQNAPKLISSSPLLV